MGDPNSTALLVVGHGTRNLQGIAEFQESLAGIARLLPKTTVESCFLEMAEPTIDSALSRLARRGAQEVVVLPLLLFAAGHAKSDIPREAQSAARRWDLKLTFAPPLGTHPKLIELSGLRFREALGGGEIDPHNVLWVLVGRGSRDRSATAHFQQFVTLRRRATPVADARLAFLAMAPPRLESLVEEIREAPYEVVVVQPHLLFAGELLDRLQRIVDRQERSTQRQHWLKTRHLGSHPLLASAVVDLFHQAVARTGVQCETE